MKYDQPSFKRIENSYYNFLKKQEVLGEPFYDKLGQLNNFYLPICESIFRNYLKKKQTILIGLSGGQGEGKSTIAKILQLILNMKYNLNTISFSIDDFYKTLKSRKKMAKTVHKLFITRGVPGTHDTKLLNNILHKLLKKSFSPLLIPKFDKSIDDRVKKKEWTKVKKKPEIVIFEGCLLYTSPSPRDGLLSRMPSSA